MKQDNDQTIGGHAADVVDNVADGIRSAAHSVGGSVEALLTRCMTPLDEPPPLSETSSKKSATTRATHTTAREPRLAPGKKAWRILCAKIPRPPSFSPSRRRADNRLALVETQMTPILP